MREFHKSDFASILQHMMGGTQDWLNMLGKSTGARALNSARLIASYQWSRVSAKPQIWGMPSSIAIEPTTSCNLRCPECPSGLRSFSRPTGMLSSSLFESVIDELAPTLSYLTFYFQGEPYLHPQFLSMVKYAASKNIYTATSTNAHYLSSENAEKTVASGLDRLIISIDGATQETYEAYRVGGKLEKVLDGAQQVVSWKKKLQSRTPHIVFQFLVVKPNEHEVNDVRRMATALGVDQVVIKTAQIYDYANGSPLIPDQAKYSRYKRNADGTYSVKNELLNQCWKMWHSCVITWDGKVVPCCFDKDASHTLGDVTKNSFAEIWRGDQYHLFRRMLLKSRSSIDICQNCTEGTAIWAND